jgi:hypothetical protein
MKNPFDLLLEQDKKNATDNIKLPEALKLKLFKTIFL